MPENTTDTNIEDILETDKDIDYNNLSPEYKSSISKYKKEKWKEIKELEKMSKLSNIDLEKHTLFLLLNFSENPLEDMDKYGIEEKYFISDIWSKILNCFLEVSSNWKPDYIILKDNFEKKYNKKEEIQWFENFFNLKWFRPNYKMLNDYSNLLIETFNRNWLNNILKNLEVAIKNKDDDTIKYLKDEIASFSLDKRDDNPDIWYVNNEYLWNQMQEWINGWYETQRVTLKTGFKSFDNKIGWLDKWTMTVFCARPSVWKSVALINFMAWMVSEWYNCLYVSAEMYAKYIYSRWASIHLEIDNSKLKNPRKLSDKEKKRALEFSEKYKSEDNAHFYFNNIVTAREIESVAKKIEATTWKPLDAIFVDYLWKCLPNDLDTKSWRTEIVNKISNQLFWIAWKLNIAMVTATQLNRANAWNETQQSLVKPKASDIRDSWAIEQDADMLLWISRDVEEWKMCSSEEDSTEFYINMMKNRNWELSDFIYDFFPKIQKLKDIDDFETEPKTPEELAEKKKASNASKILDSLWESWEDEFLTATDIFW